MTQIEHRLCQLCGQDEQPGRSLTVADLAALCQNAMELARGSRGPLSRLQISCGEISLELEWAREVQSVGGLAVAPAGSGDPEPVVTGPKLITVTAPIVGTFYHAPEPGADPFVKVGDLVEPGQTVGILEAMKLLNPIEADQAGRVKEILVPDATAVEFAQPLIALQAVDGTG